MQVLTVVVSAGHGWFVVTGLSLDDATVLYWALMR